MKLTATLLSLFVFAAAFAQDQPPTPDQIRQEIAGQIASFKIAPQRMYRIENRKVAGNGDSIRVRLYYPKAGRKLRIIYHIHGGALVAGDLDTHENICRLLANRTGSIVVALDYRRPPEAPYPASLDDCTSVLAWIRKTARSWGGDPSNLVLLGDSGGGLLATALEVKQQGVPSFKKIVLINPATDLRTPGEGFYGLVTQMYLNGRSANDSLVSPIIATNVSFFPPTLIVTCEKDILKPHGQQLYDKLKAAHVPARIVDIPNEDHLGGYWSATHPKAKQAIDEAVAFIMKDTRR